MSGAKYQDSDWDFNITTTIPQRLPFSVSCAKTLSCWLWTHSSLFTYGPDGHWTELGAELKERGPFLQTVLISQEVGWVVTRDGLYQTKDGGKGWERISVAQLDGGKGRIHAVYFIDEQRGWIAGGKYQEPLKDEALPNNARSDDGKRVLIGCVLVTSDGGANWREMQVKRAIGRFDEIMFAGSFGLTVGDAGMQTITNAEEHWTKALYEFRDEDTGEIPEVLSGFLLDERSGWVSLSGAKLIRTNDSGKSWSVIYPSQGLGKVSEAVTLSNLLFVDDQRGLALSRQLGSGNLYKTNDGGKSWSQIVSESNFSGLGKVVGTSLVIAVADDAVYSLSVKSNK